MLCGSVFLALLFLLASPADALITLATVLLFCLAGVFLGMALFGRISWKRPEGLILGSAFGLAFSEFAVLLTGYLAAWEVRKLTAGWLLVTLAMFLATRRRWDRPILEGVRPWEPEEWPILGAMILVLFAFVAIPFLNFGKLTEFGYGYTWLFGFDFILRGSYVAGITLGLPPDFLHLSGTTFRYYLVSYVGPAFAYTLGHKTGSLLSILLIYTLLADVLFVACLFTLLRHFIVNRRALGWTVAVGMGAYSYYSWYALARRVFSSLPPSWGDMAFAGALLKYGDVSHLFQRLFLVEPQAITGLGLIAAIICVLEALHYRLRRFDVACVLGIALGAEFGIDALLGLIVALWFGFSFLFRWFRDRQLIGDEFAPVAACVLVCAATNLSYFAVGMYSFADRGAMALEPYWWLMRLAPAYFVVEFGPMLFLGLWGIWKMRKNDRTRISSPLALLAGLVVAQVFFVRVGVLPRERLAERLLPFVLLIWTGYFFEDLLLRKSKRRALFAGVLIAAAVPTFFTDIRYTSAVHDPARTGYVAVADMEACRWIRRHVPENAVLQSEPNYSGRCGQPAHEVAAISLIPDFAERRETLGEWYVAGTTLVSSKPIEDVRAHDVTRLFAASDMEEVVKIVSKYGIDYLYVGPCEQKGNPRLLDILRGSPHLFQEVYSRADVHIFNWNHHLPPLNPQTGEAEDSAEARLGDGVASGK